MHILVHHTRPDGEPYPVTECRIYKAVREGRGVHVDDEVLWRRDGTSFPSEYWSYPMWNDGELVGVVLTFVDITERREVEDQLLVAKAAAEQASDAKSQFMANMSHELRTPMNAILGYSEMLIEDAEDGGLADMVDDLKKINVAGRHLLELINAVLDLSKIEAGRMDLHIEPIDVVELLEGVMSVARPLVEHNGNELVEDWDDSIGVIESDATKVRQSLLNVLSNAAKFTSEGSVTVSVDRVVIDGREQIRFAIADTGTGIAADKLDHVFEEFAQAEETTSRDYGGTGLGLSLTRHLCRLMGGDIVLESELGVGSTFTIRLPVVSERGAPSRPEPVAGPLASGHAGVEVLVIDDDVHSRDLLQRTLEGVGYRVVVAGDGASGVALARELRPQVITLDILMPGMDGWAVLSELKSDPVTSEIPVVMLSIAPDRDLAYVMGAVESLPKPIDRRVLRDVLRRYITDGRNRVLVVDDDENSRRLLVRHVESEGWEAVEAQNGAVALDRVRESTPDLVLLDLMMPVMDGFEFVEQLRAVDDHRELPIVVVTAKTLTADDQARLRGSVERVIDKGQGTSEEVLRSIRELAGSSAGRAVGSDASS
jgi:signal transduction histidine kinase/DNA-binding response OmpR family regulator